MPILVGRDVGATGFGLMSLTTPPGKATPRDQAFEAMNAALESGANFWNGGQFYGTPDNNSLHLLRDYFTKFPAAADRVVLSIKGGLDKNRIPNGSPEFVRECVEACLEILPPTIKKIDIFQCARVDPKTPIEKTMEAMKKLVEEGKFGAIGLSEVRKETIRKVSEIVTIAAVEVEVSMFEPKVLTNGVAATCAELKIPLIPYSPLGRGILTGKWTAVGDIPKDSPLNRLDKYQGDNLAQNLKLVHELQKLSEEHAPSTMAQLAMSWLRQLSETHGLPVMIPIAGSTKAENVRSNGVHVNLTQADMEAIDQLLAKNQTVGDRAYTGQKQYLEG